MIIVHAKELLYQEKLQNSVRLIGVTISNLNTEKEKKSSNLKQALQVQLSLPF
jgi:DNA polymerase-4